ncbi:MAG: AbrB/MazE/SpoVT family DNA-binding domain-containing protein [Chloroflexota bacterium]
MVTVKVSRKNQIAVPAAVRRQLGIQPGDRLSVQVEGSRLVLQREPEDILGALLGLAPEVWQGVDGTAYLRGLRDEWTSPTDSRAGQGATSGLGWTRWSSSTRWSGIRSLSGPQKLSCAPFSRAG